MRALLQRVTRAEVRVGERVGRVDRPRAAGPAGRGPRRRRGDRRRAGAPDLRAAHLRGRGRADEPLAARRGRRGPGREPVHALRGHESRPAARVHRRGAAGPRDRVLWLRVAAGIEAQGVRTGSWASSVRRWPSSWSTTGRSRSGSTRPTDERRARGGAGSLWRRWCWPAAAPRAGSTATVAPPSPPAIRHQSRLRRTSTASGLGGASATGSRRPRRRAPARQREPRRRARASPTSTSWSWRTRSTARSSAAATPRTSTR